MATYIAKRLLQFVPTLVLVSIITFTLVRFVPGDPIYGPFAAGIFELDALGPCDSELTRLPFRKINRPLWPFDPDLQEPW